MNERNDMRIEINCNNNMNGFDEQKKQRKERLGFEPQKEISFNQYLPYCEQLDAESVQYLSLIKSNIGRTLVLNDRHGFAYISHLSKYY